MRGLFDIFRRHLPVLTKFLRNDGKSRLIGQEAGKAEARTREGPRGYRPGPAGVGPGCSAHWVSRPHTHPLRPCRGYGARFAGVGPPLAVVGFPCWTLYYHPVYPPRIPTLVPYRSRTHPLCTKLTVQYTVPDTRFWDTVGEPRGIETQLVSGSQAGLYL